MAGAAAIALGALAGNAGATDPDKAADRTHTMTPIKHVIVVLAENSSFAHTFGTFRPRDGQHIANLLSKGSSTRTARWVQISARPMNFQG